MTSISHLSKEEQQHYILCDCGAHIDMRNLSEVFEHLHANLAQPQWTHSIKKDEPVAYLRSGRTIDLN